MAIYPIVYATKSHFKQAEAEIILASGKFSDGTPVGTVMQFDFRNVSIKEDLEVRIEDMVRAEVLKAYSQLKVPCIVEHAGLIWDEFCESHYPGGLTKPMWNALSSSFIEETRSAGRRVTAHAAVAYCDGQKIQVFTGETKGSLADTPRGKREYYWDTIFIPDAEDGSPGAQTYAEIVADPKLGLEHKVLIHSQSTKAIMKFLNYRRQHDPELWPEFR